MDVPKHYLFSILVVSLVVLFSDPLEAAPKASLITHLPGFNGTFPSKHYSGYVRFKGQRHPTRRHLFYYFVESERNPSKDPVVLWLNGGPGCSSFDGFVYEHGPFNFEAPQKQGEHPILHLNPHSWSKVSNIIYLDSPSGVGFSYPSIPTGDLQTASDTHTFLRKWFKLYPEFQANPFYITGESYAGIYVPTLVSRVAKGIRKGAKPKINLKGYMIGNGLCDSEFDGLNSLIQFVHGMGIISDKLLKEAEVACDGNYERNEDKTQCTTALAKIAELIMGLNMYDILEPCYHKKNPEATSTKNTSLPKSFQELGKTDKPLPVRKRMFGRAWPYRAPVRDGIVPTWPQLTQSLQARGVSVPCTNDEVATAWLNDEAVRKAIHASPKSGNWNLCLAGLEYNHDAGSMLSYHHNLTSKGYRALIYSGDHDMCVPFTGTEAWTASLGYKVEDEWRPWMTNHQIAGYLQKYAHNLTFLTVKGAGHTVPEYKPRESLHFYSRWLEGERI
ncbi:serine carboxypeptidase-like 21 [Coffea eugenioides]|uniref:serine carboxypeptidase-like 21 n=1 Tax=Coffea eugenioides TaxID=49369 RepID=UPI000F605BC7|nr:serine carboxypeptidase-like 21 [Coffea eugenioides]